MSKKSSSGRPTWQEVVQKEAYEATLVEAKTRWGLQTPFFNHRWEHVQAVVRLASRLAELTDADRDVVEAAAWLHDCRKKGRGDNHGDEGARAARQILAQTDFPVDKIEAVADAIAKHIGLYLDEPVEPLEAAVLWDADKLSKLGTTSVLHYIEDWIATERGTVAQLAEHFACLEWPERAVNSLHTAPARAAGQRRLANQLAFWKQLVWELGGDDLEEETWRG